MNESQQDSDQGDVDTDGLLLSPKPEIITEEVDEGEDCHMEDQSQ